MAYIFGDSFDLYATPADAVAGGYWDAGTATAGISIIAGRFAGGQAFACAGGANNTLNKTSGVNDGVHHIVCAFRQTAALSGTTLGYYFQLSDGATAQCSVVFRSDGAILLTSGGPGGTVLATYTGAVTIVNQWFAFEIEIVINNTTGSFAVRTNGATSNSFSATGLNTRGGTTNNYANKLTVAMNTAVNAQHTDDILWRSDASSVAWVGDVRTYVRMPASDASVQFSRPNPTAFPLLVAPNVSTLSITANGGRFAPFTALVSGTVSTVTVPVAAASTANIKCAIYASSGGAPTTVLGTATPIAAPGIGTATFTFGTPVSVTQGTQYWVAYNADTTSGSFGASVTSIGVGGVITYASFPANNPTGLSALAAAAFTVYITGTSNFPWVAESQQDGATTYVYDSNVGDADFYGIGAIGVTPASVVAVTTRGFIQKSDAGSRSGAVQLKSGSTTVQSTPGPVSTTFAWMWRTDVTDPATGAAWTPTGVNNAQIGPTVTA